LVAGCGKGLCGSQLAGSKNPDLETSTEGKKAESLVSKLDAIGKKNQSLQETAKVQQVIAGHKVQKRNLESSKQQISANQANQGKGVCKQLNGGKYPTDMVTLEGSQTANMEGNNAVSHGISALSKIPHKESCIRILERGNFSGKEDAVQKESLPNEVQELQNVNIEAHEASVDTIHELAMITAKEQRLLNEQCLITSDSTFFIDLNYAARKNFNKSLDDDMGLYKEKELPDRGYYTDDEVSDSTFDPLSHGSQSPPSSGHKHILSQNRPTGMITRSKSKRVTFSIPLND
ncbi:unnamed protein product, partial [Ilex paraguariensis]